MALNPIDEIPGPTGYPVVIVTSALSAGNVGAPYFQDLDANSGYPPYTWSLVSGSLPTGTSLDPSGFISGVPTTVGTFTFDIAVEDLILDQDVRTFSIQIDAVTNPVIITTSLPPGPVGTAYSETLQAVGGTPPYTTWSVIAGSLPTGLSLSSGGVLSGTPTVPGTYIFTIEVTDSGALTDQQAYQLLIQSLTPVITTTSVPNGTTSLPYSTTILAAGGATPYISWNVIAGSLPPGLVLNGFALNATITGTPTASGSFGFTVQVEDTNNALDTQAYTLTVANGAVPTIYTSTLPFAPTGVPYSTTVQAAGGALPYTWNIISGSLPAGLSLDSSTGNITGTPTVNGSYVFRVEVTDFNNITDSKLLTIVVGNFILPSIVTPFLMNGSVGTPYSDFTQALGGVLPYGWGIIGSLPPGLAINPLTGEITGIPTTSGSYSFSVVVTDDAANIDVEPYTIEIEDANLPIIVTTSVDDASLDIPYNQTLQAAGGTPGYTWLILSGSPPPGITISSNGILSGTPTLIGLYNFTVRITDALGQIDTQDYRLLVKGSGFDSNCCFCVFTDTLLTFDTNVTEGQLTATGGTVVNLRQWRSPSVPGIYIVKLFTEGVNGKMRVINTVEVVQRLELLNVVDNQITHLMPGDTYQIETNFLPDEVEWETLGDCLPTVTPQGNIVINSNAADQCFGAMDCVIRGKVVNPNCIELLNYQDIRIIVDPVYPTPDICGPYFSKWLRDGHRFNVIRTEFSGGCSEEHLQNRVPIFTWTINYEGLQHYKTEDVTCPNCQACIIICGCPGEGEQPPIYKDGCHPYMRSANRLDAFWNFCYGSYRSFTLIDQDTGEVWYKVKFNADDLSYDHRHRRRANFRTVKLIWRPCCSKSNSGGTCDKHGVPGYRKKTEDCNIKPTCAQTPTEEDLTGDR